GGGGGHRARRAPRPPPRRAAGAGRRRRRPPRGAGGRRDAVLGFGRGRRARLGPGLRPGGTGLERYEGLLAAAGGAGRRGGGGRGRHGPRRLRDRGPGHDARRPQPRRGAPRPPHRRARPQPRAPPVNRQEPSRSAGQWTSPAPNSESAKRASRETPRTLPGPSASKKLWVKRRFFTPPRTFPSSMRKVPLRVSPVTTWVLGSRIRQ